MSRYADLHIHTHFSDSTSSPQDVIERVSQNNIDCIAIADHDTIDGLQPTMEAARESKIEVLPGIELSSELNGKDIHMLGYLFDFENTQLKKQLAVIQDSRIERMERMIEKLRGCGIDDISLKEVCGLAKSKAVGRPHLAIKMMEKGWVKSIKEAFDKYLADGAKAYVAKYKQSPSEAIKLIHEYGGVAVLAHPMSTRIDELIPQLVKEGLDGLEVYYPNTSENVRLYYEGLAKKNGVIMTGGSDDHGTAKKNTHIGIIRIPYDLVEELKKCQKKR